MSTFLLNEGDLVRTWDAAADLPRVPLIVLEPLLAHLGGIGIGWDSVEVERLGEGHSNETFALVSGPDRIVLRRPPRPPLPPTAHDVVREARLINALGTVGVRVPRILDICEDEAVIGAPFALMEHVRGEVMSTHLPAVFAAPHHHGLIATELIEALAEVHSADLGSPALRPFNRRGSGYLERQVARFTELWERNATRSIPEMDAVGKWLAGHRPARSDSTVVHGDFRLGNVVFSPGAAPKLEAILDWEMGTIGDPLADLGYLVASWGRPGDEPGHPIRALSAATRADTFPGRDELRQLYESRTGRATDELRWYEVLALWKGAVFLEGSYRRKLAGSADDPYFTALDAGVPILAREALRSVPA